ncbi:hypothetical protein HQ576_17740, partial [bacterium]|nr:hypothetical protein [bacterium]
SPGEIIKFSKVGVVLVWRWHPEDAAKEDETKKRKVYWYIGYLAGLGANPPDTAVTHQRRGCFGTEIKDIVEGAKFRLDCLKVANDGRPTLMLARGHREEVVTTIPQPDGDNISVGQRDGYGVFQLLRDPNYFEWIRFTYPQFQPEEDETALLGGEAGPWMVGITRSAESSAGMGEGDTGREFAAADRIMPVFFGHGHTSVTSSTQYPIVKGRGDQVTLTDQTGQREPKVLCHASGRLFSFQNHVMGTFLYSNGPRILKFPSGHLPTRPDKALYIGSDAVCQDGDASKPFTEGYEDASALSPTEPERPANATFDEIKIYPAGGYRTARLYDWITSTPGDPKTGRWKNFTVGSDAPPITAALAPPFTIRVGHLEGLTPQPGGDPPPFVQPYRFAANGHANLPQEGYLKVDDECMFYRTLYRNRSGNRSASVVLPASVTYNADGFAVALTAGGNAIYVDEKGADFPEQGYITISNSWPSPTYWQRVQTLGGGEADTLQAILAWLQENTWTLLNDSGGHLHTTGSYSAPERIFYDKKTKTTIDGKEVWRLDLKHRGILDSTAHDVKFVNPDNPPSWFVSGEQGVGGGSADVHVMSAELLVLRRACLGTPASTHAIGTVVMPLEHIPTSLAPRPLVKLKRDLDTEQLQRDPADTNVILALADEASASGTGDLHFDITEPEYEYGLVLEDADGFPAEGYVQVGDEILAYAELVPRASVPMWDVAQGKWVRKTLPCLAGIKHFRQRYGTARADFLDYRPTDAGALKFLDPGVPDPAFSPGDSQYQIQPTPPYWTDGEKHIVHARSFRYHDRFPQREPAKLLEAGFSPDTSVVGKYAPHWNDTQLGYYEFAVTLPGARWTSVQWAELLYDSDGTLSNDPLDTSDPFDVKVLVQIDGAPGWDDMTPDPAAGTGGLVSTPVLWSEFPSRGDAYNDDPDSYRPRKPVIFLFDEAYDPDDTSSRPDNYINPYKDGASLHLRGQSGDRLRLRVFFQYKHDDPPVAAPGYSIPWRTPWVDTIVLKYKAPTYVMEHREVNQ